MPTPVASATSTSAAMIPPPANHPPRARDLHVQCEFSTETAAACSQKTAYLQQHMRRSTRKHAQANTLLGSTQMYKTQMYRFYSYICEETRQVCGGKERDRTQHQQKCYPLPFSQLCSRINSFKGRTISRHWAETARVTFSNKPSPQQLNFFLI